MDKGFKVSVVVPCYNEEGNIKILCDKLETVLENYPKWEVLLIDDGSVDNTLNIIKDLKSTRSWLKYISFSRNFGHQNALKAGIDCADGDCVISMDGDMQHPVELIPQMIDKWKEGFDVVCTIRKVDDNLSYFKKKSSNVFYRLINSLSDINIDQGSADFRLIDKKVQAVFKNDINEFFLFFRGLTSWVGFKQFAIEYKPLERYAGESKYSFFKMLNFAINGITSFSVKPLRFAVLLGLVISLFSFIYGMYALYIHLFTENAIQGWTSVIISVLFIGGIQLVILGIIGEYIGKTFFEVKGRPCYIVKEQSL